VVRSNLIFVREVFGNIFKGSANCACVTRAKSYCAGQVLQPFGKNGHKVDYYCIKFTNKTIKYTFPDMLKKLVPSTAHASDMEKIAQ